MKPNILSQDFKKLLIDKFEDAKKDLKNTITNNINDINIDVIKVGNNINIGIAFDIGRIKDTCWVVYTLPLTAIKEELFKGKQVTENQDEDKFLRSVGINTNYKATNPVTEPISVLLTIGLIAIIYEALSEIDKEELEQEIKLIEVIMLSDKIKIHDKVYSIEGLYKISKEDVEEFVVALKVTDTYIQYVSLEDVMSNLDKYKFMKNESKEDDNV